MLTITIDWLAVNFKEYTHAAERFMRTHASSNPIQDATPRFGYSRATMDDNGVVIQWNPDRTDMGHHVIFSGSSLRNIFSKTEVQPRTLLRSVHDAGGSVSRLDLAKDCTGKTIDLQSVYKSLEQGDNRGNARTFGQIRSNDNGHTIYIGSRQSERFIRIYDKAAQEHIQGMLWTRLELETKGMVARALSAQLLVVDAWESTFDAVVQGMVLLPDRTLMGAFFEQGVCKIGLPKIEKQTDRERWISDQVISAVAKHYIDHPESKGVKRLRDILDLIDNQRSGKFDNQVD